MKAGRCLSVSSALARLLTLSQNHSFPRTVLGFNSPFSVLAMTSRAKWKCIVIY